jgi:hypothetical protein
MWTLVKISDAFSNALVKSFSDTVQISAWKMIFRPCYNSDLLSWETCNMENHRSLILMSKPATEDMSKNAEPPPELIFAVCEVLCDTLLFSPHSAEIDCGGNF